MPSSTLLAAPSHAPCPVRAGAAPEVGPGKRMRRQILLKPAAPPTPPWSAGNYPSDTTFANPFTRHLAPSHATLPPHTTCTIPASTLPTSVPKHARRRADGEQGATRGGTSRKQEAGRRTQGWRIRGMRGKTARAR